MELPVNAVTIQVEEDFVEVAIEEVGMVVLVAKVVFAQIGTEV